MGARVTMRRGREWVFRHRGEITAVVVVLVLSCIPALVMKVGIGDEWRGIVPTFTDELNFARVHTIAEGNLTDGNPYFFEHKDGPPLVVFGGAWLNALVIALPLPLIATLYINFVLWSILFALTAYLVFKKFGVARLFAIGGTAILYLGALRHVWRPANLQPVYPFYFLFLFALVHFLEAPTKRRAVVLGVATGLTFYFYAFLWQMAVATLLVVIASAIVLKHKELMRGGIRALLVGLGVGLPIPLYIFFLSHTSPVFWESLGRLGLVTTHLPTSEVLYSGGWVIITICLLWFLARSASFWERWSAFVLFCITSGLGLLMAQTSNVVTGSWFETGEHMRVLIIPWLTIATVAMISVIRQSWRSLPYLRRYAVAAGATALCGASLYFSMAGIAPFLHPRTDGVAWRAEQGYAGALGWLREHAPSSVVWVDPHAPLANVLPYYTNDYVLYSYWGGFELMSDNEWYERYLVARYFDRPSTADLSATTTMGYYLGRRDLFHQAKTIEREVKVCRMLFFWRHAVCGDIPTSQSLLGQAFFSGLANHFANDIAPNIKDYLQKYHVSYVLKNTAVNTSWRPEALGATRVYADNVYEIYRFPWSE